MNSPIYFFWNFPDDPTRSPKTIGPLAFESQRGHEPAYPPRSASICPKIRSFRADYVLREVCGGRGALIAGSNRVRWRYAGSTGTAPRTSAGAPAGGAKPKSPATRAKAAAIFWICASLCAADTLQRSIEMPLGVPGGIAKLV